MRSLTQIAELPPDKPVISMQRFYYIAEFDQSAEYHRVYLNLDRVSGNLLHWSVTQI